MTIGVRHVLCFLVLAGTLASCTGRGARPGVEQMSAADAAQRAEVVRAAERLFEGMRTRDTAVLRTLLAPELVIVAARGDGSGVTIRTQNAADFLRAVASSKTELRERLWDPDVHIDGAIAVLWAPYDFHLGEQFSHCGHDAFQLARGDRGWYVTGLTYTVHTTGCTGAPSSGRG